MRNLENSTCEKRKMRHEREGKGGGEKQRKKGEKKREEEYT